MVKIAALATLGKNCVPNKVWNFVQCLPGSRCLHSTFQQSFTVDAAFLTPIHTHTNRSVLRSECFPRGPGKMINAQVNVCT